MRGGATASVKNLTTGTIRTKNLNDLEPDVWVPFDTGSDNLSKEYLCIKSASNATPMLENNEESEINQLDLYDKFVMKGHKRVKPDVLKSTKDSKTLTIISYNSEGYREQEITSLTKKFKPDALCIQESKLTSNLLEEKKDMIKGYTLSGTSNDAHLGQRERMRYYETIGIATLVNSNHQKNMLTVKYKKRFKDNPHKVSKDQN